MSIESVIKGAIKSTFDAHGNVLERKDIGSLVKRITHQLKAKSGTIPHLLEIWHDDDGELQWSIQHPEATCPVTEERVDVNPMGWVYVSRPDCPFEFELEHVGSDAFLEGLPQDDGFYVVHHFVEKGYEPDDVVTGIVVDRWISE